MEKIVFEKGNPWDNACSKAFIPLSRENGSTSNHFLTNEEGRKPYSNILEGFYNTIRTIPIVGYESPMEYEKNYKILKKMAFKKKIEKRH
ncbi:hypothetical protein [Dubosiella newyorkensis]|uniref:hypothetical protein n=1 Tax=Dubosiella newyorkensis TaxID=1862672 RepID=UPI003F67F63B